MKHHHADLSKQAECPQEEECDGYSVELVVDEFVVLIDFKDESIVDIVASEDLDT